jgi:hypothetical protein
MTQAVEITAREEIERKEEENFAMKKNIVYIPFAVFVLLLAQNAAYCLEGQPVASQDALAPEVPCPGENFLTFLAKFIDDEAIQRAFTMYPLTKLELDIDAEPEPKEFVRYLTRDQVQFPVFPLKQERAEVPLEIKVGNVSDNNAKVTIAQPDTDYIITYYFRKNGCWRLERIEDWSL